MRKSPLTPPYGRGGSPPDELDGPGSPSSVHSMPAYKILQQLHHADADSTHGDTAKPAAASSHGGSPQDYATGRTWGPKAPMSGPLTQPGSKSPGGLSTPSPEEMNAILHCMSLQTSPSRTQHSSARTGSVRSRTTSAGSRTPTAGVQPKSDLTRRFQEMLKEPLTDDNLVWFVGSFKRLRAQAYISRGVETRGTAVEQSDLKLRTLMGDASEKLERAFRRCLEESTRPVDGRLLLRCASDADLRNASGSSEMSEGDTATRVTPLCGSSQEFKGGGAGAKGSLEVCTSLLTSGDSPGTQAQVLPLFSGTVLDEEGDHQTHHSHQHQHCQAQEHPLSSGTAPASPHQPEPQNTTTKFQDVEVPGIRASDVVSAEERIIASGEAVQRLQRLAQAIVDCGLDESCSRAYTEVRSAKVLSSLRAMGLGPRTRDEAQSLGVAEADECIKQWRRQVTLAVTSVLAAERALCQCLGGSPRQPGGSSQAATGQGPWLVDQAMQALGQEVASTLMPMADALAEGLKGEAKLVLILDLLEALRDVRPLLEQSVQGGAPGAHLCSRMRSLVEKVKGAVRNGVREFKEFIENEDQEPVPRTGTFPDRGLVAYSMKIITVLTSYQATLEAVFEGSQLKDVLEGLLEALKRHADSQAQQLDNEAQAEFFLMNNLRFITESIRCSSGGFQEVLGARWVNRHGKMVQQHAMAYQRIAWTPVLVALDQSSAFGDSDSAFAESGSLVGKTGSQLLSVLKVGKWVPSPRDRMEEFTRQFGRVFMEQRGWIIPDEVLRDAIRGRLEGLLVDQFRSFSGLQKGVQWPKSFNSRASSKTATLSEDLLRLFINDLFSGKATEEGTSFEDLLAAVHAQGEAALA